MHKFEPRADHGGFGVVWVAMGQSLSRVATSVFTLYYFRHATKLCRSGDRMPVGVRFSTPVQTGPGTYSASYVMKTRSLLGVKRPGRGSEHPLLPSVMLCSPYNRPARAQRGSRGIALLILNLGARGLLVSTTPRPLYPRERTGIHCTGGWVGPRAGLDVCEKLCTHLL
jgi:hypothetical protein